MERGKIQRDRKRGICIFEEDWLQPQEDSIHSSFWLGR